MINSFTSSFSIARLPHIEFGSGCVLQVPTLASKYGKRFLYVTGAGSIENNNAWTLLNQEFDQLGFTYKRVKIGEEPSPDLIDSLVAEARKQPCDFVFALGGGSVLDAAKAIAGLIPQTHSVMDYLEGVGPELPYQGPRLPFIAAPTTAGTGSEATKNSVLSRLGEDGFKKSFRDEQLVPDYAIIDPDLLESCTPPMIAANGMDAFTQLLESYVSLRANPLTDALAWDGLVAANEGLLPWYENKGDQDYARSCMAYASMVSGITLAQTGLGSVHGLASPLGAFFPIPHGVVCGTLVATATRINLHALRRRAPDSPALVKYARVGRLLAAETKLTDEQACDALVQTLENWTQRLQLPLLTSYSVTAADFAKVVANSRGSSMKTNPVVLTDDEIRQILAQRI